MQRLRVTAVVLAAAFLHAACAGGAHRAPVDERNTGGAHSQSGYQASHTGEGGDSDWTATVRPLGDSSPSATPLPAPRTQTVAGGAGESVNPAVVSLLNTANAQSRSGDYARAAATLERAIAIEPANAWLWHRLAVTRLNEGRLEQAAGLAAKSNALPGADRALQAGNWKVIAEVRRRQGDAGAAAAAESKAAQLAN